MATTFSAIWVTGDVCVKTLEPANLFYAKSIKL